MLVLFIQMYRTQLRKAQFGSFGRTKPTKQLLFMIMIVILWIFFAMQIWMNQAKFALQNQQTVIAFAKAIPWWMGLDAVVFQPIIEEILFKDSF